MAISFGQASLLRMRLSTRFPNASTRTGATALKSWIVPPTASAVGAFDLAYNGASMCFWL